MNASRLARRAVAMLAAVALTPQALLAAGDDATVAGAYCPLPEPGQVPQCLAPARAEFGDFFQAVDTGGVDTGESSDTGTTQ